MSTSRRTWIGPAMASHSDRPATSPAGTPTSAAATATIVACHRTVADASPGACRAHGAPEIAPPAAHGKDEGVGHGDESEAEHGDGDGDRHLAQVAQRADVGGDEPAVDDGVRRRQLGRDGFGIVVVVELQEEVARAVDRRGELVGAQCVETLEREHDPFARVALVDERHDRLADHLGGPGPARAGHARCGRRRPRRASPSSRRRRRPPRGRSAGGRSA